MIEFYNNSFSNNYLNHKTFLDINCELSFNSLVDDNEYSCSFSEFDYIKGIKKRINCENTDKLFEETKISKEKITKNKSISSFKNTAENIFKQKSIETLSGSCKAQKEEAPKNIRDLKLSNKHIKNGFNINQGNPSNLANINVFYPSVDVESNYSFDILANLTTPTNFDKKCNDEKLEKSRYDFRSKFNDRKNNYHIYDCGNNNFENDKKNDNNNFDYKLLNNKLNNNEIIKKSNNSINKEILESSDNTLFNYKNQQNFNLLQNRQIQKNYQNNKTNNKKIQLNQLKSNFNHLNFINKKSLNTNLLGQDSPKVKANSETNIITIYNELNIEKNLTKINKDEKAFLTDEESAQIEKVLITKILQIRAESVNKIIKNFRIYKKAQLQKEEKLISEILTARKTASISIQASFRSFFIRKNIKTILNKLDENYIFVYNYNKKYFQNNKGKSLENNANEYEEEPNHDIKLQLLGNGSKKAKNCEVLNFEYSKFLKSYLLVFKKKGLIRRNYKINFIVNGNIIIDPRFKLDADEDGKFYNVIESYMLMFRNKIKSYENKLRFEALHSKANIHNNSKFASINNTLKKANGIYSKNKANEKANDNIIIYDNENIFQNAQNKNSDCEDNKASLNISLKESKYWEDIFKIKLLNNYRSLNTNSVSDASDSKDFDRIFTMKSISKLTESGKSNTPQLKSSLNIKPCLKKQSSNDFGPLKKSVSFSENIQISFFTVQ